MVFMIYKMAKRIVWLGHDSFRVASGRDLITILREFYVKSLELRR